MDTEQLEQRHGLSLLQFFHKINNIIRVRSSVSVPIVEGPWCLIALHEGITSIAMILIVWGSRTYMSHRVEDTEPDFGDLLP